MFNFVTNILGKKTSVSTLKEPLTQPITKLIFLDIDGVLNNSKSDLSQLYVIDDDLIKILKDIVNQTGANLVLSTTWRYTTNTRELLKKYLKENDIPCYISCTPNFGTNRVDEILCWLNENTDFVCPENPEFEGLSLEQSKNLNDLPQTELKLVTKLFNVIFIVLDDMDLTKEGNNFSYIGDRFIHINKKIGITRDNADLAIKLLNNV